MARLNSVNIFIYCHKLRKCHTDVITSAHTRACTDTHHLPIVIHKWVVDIFEEVGILWREESITNHIHDLFQLWYSVIILLWLVSNNQTAASVSIGCTNMVHYMKLWLIKYNWYIELIAYGQQKGQHNVWKPKKRGCWFGNKCNQKIGIWSYLTKWQEHINQTANIWFDMRPAASIHMQIQNVFYNKYPPYCK